MAQVLAAKDATEARALFSAHEPEIDLLVLDVTLPGGDGAEPCCPSSRLVGPAPVSSSRVATSRRSPPCRADPDRRPLSSQTLRPERVDPSPSGGRPSPTSWPSRRGCLMASIVVVGGGLAGLVCGQRLVRAGHDVEVFEAGATVGGRLRPIETEHGCSNPRSGNIGWGDANCRALVAGLGLEPAGDAFLKRKHALVLGGRLHRPPPLRRSEFLFPRSAPRMDRPIDAVFRKPPRWRDRKPLVRAIWDSFGSPRLDAPDSVRALDDTQWQRASVRAFGTRWVTTRLALRSSRARASTSPRSRLRSSCRCSRGCSPVRGRSVPLQGGIVALVEALADPLRLRYSGRKPRADRGGRSDPYRSGGRTRAARWPTRP